MKKWMSGVRGAIVMVALWVIGWGFGFGGIMELVDPDGKIQDVWPTLLAVPGFIGGIVFSVGVAGNHENTFCVINPPGQRGRLAEVSLKGKNPHIRDRLG